MGYAQVTNYKYSRSFSAQLHFVVMVLLFLGLTDVEYSNHQINSYAMYSNSSQSRFEKDLPFKVITAKEQVNLTFLDNFKLDSMLWDPNPLSANYPLPHLITFILKAKVASRQPVANSFVEVRHRYSTHPLLHSVCMVALEYTLDTDLYSLMFL